MNADPVHVLERLGPPPGWSERTDIDADPVAARILDRVLTDSGNVLSLDAARRRSIGSAIGGAIVVGALATGGAVAALWHHSPDQTRPASCWSEAAREPTTVVGLRWDGAGHRAVLCASQRAAMGDARWDSVLSSVDIH